MKQGGRYGSSAAGGAKGSSAAAASSAAPSLGVVHSDIVFSVCAGSWDAEADAPTFYSGGEDRLLAHWRGPSVKGQTAGAVLSRVAPPNPAAHGRCISDMVFAPKTRALYTASRDKTVKQWLSGGEDGGLVAGHTFSGHSLPVSCVAASPEGDRIVSGSRDYFVRFWDAASGQCLFWPEMVQQNIVTALRWLPRGEEAVLQASEDLTLRVWDVRSKQLAQSFDDGPYFALHADVSPDGQYFLTGHNGFEGVGCEIKMFDRRTGRKCLDIQAASQALTDAQFVQRGEGAAGSMLAATASKDGSLRVWDLALLLAAGGEAAAEVGLLAAQQLDLSESVQSLCSAPLSSQAGQAVIATGHVNGSVSTWTLNGRTLQRTMQSQGQADDS